MRCNYMDQWHNANFVLFNNLLKYKKNEYNRNMQKKDIKLKII